MTNQSDVPSSDLTAHARIRNAALEGFAREGVAATSIRDVAKAAGVSPGLVQHHFSSKAELVRAVNDHVIAIAVATFSGDLDSGPQADIFQQVGDRITGLVRENPLALIYVARSAADGDGAALGMFDAFVAIAREQILAMADQGVIDPDTDLDWLALHSVVYNLGTVLLEQAISRHLPEPFFTDRQLQRWNEATTTLTRRGTYRSAT